MPSFTSAWTTSARSAATARTDQEASPRRLLTTGGLTPRGLTRRSYPEALLSGGSLLLTTYYLLLPTYYLLLPTYYSLLTPTSHYSSETSPSPVSYSTPSAPSSQSLISYQLLFSDLPNKSQSLPPRCSHEYERQRMDTL